MEAMIKRVLAETHTRKLRLTVYKVPGQGMLMSVQEWEVDPLDRRWEKMVLFQSFHRKIAEEPAKRVTQKMVDAFYQKHLPAAEEVAREWVRYHAPQSQEV